MEGRLLRLALFALFLFPGVSIAGLGDSDFSEGGDYISSITNVGRLGAVAASCGETIQPRVRAKTVRKMVRGRSVLVNVGRSRCAEAVRQMVGCVHEKMTGSNGDCRLKNYVCAGSAKKYNPKRTDGQRCKREMGNCSYRPVAVNNSNCRKPGAVRIYNATPTPAGSIHGHIEMVGIKNGKVRYYSVYGKPLSNPWPRSTPDACYLPALSAAVAEEG